jgi:predicted dehydrogenase
MSQPVAELRFGVIGCGVIAYWQHLRILQSLPGARLVAASDPDAAARERARKLTGVEVHAEAAALLAREDVDAVVVAAPTPLHAELGAQAAEAGKHAYLEKPAASDCAGADRLAAAFAASGVTCAVGFNRRSHPLCRQARELIASGKLGAVRGVLSTFNEPLGESSMPGWKARRSSGGGVLLDLGSHHLDLIPWLLGDKIARVRGRMRSLVTEDDDASLTVETAGGVSVQSHFSFRAGRADFVEFLAEGGTLRIDRHGSRLTLRTSRRFGYGLRSSFVAPNWETLRFQATRAVRPSFDPSYAGALAQFVHAVRLGGAPGASLEDGLRNLRVVLACEQSALEDRTIEITSS